MRIFISYASEDRGLAEPLALSLRSNDHDVFFDRDGLPPGAAFDRAIKDAIDAADLFIFLISPTAVEQGRYTLTEMGLARAKWPTPHRRVLAVVSRPTPMAAIPAYLKAATLLQPDGNLTAEVSHTVERYYGRPNTSVAVATMATVGLATGGLSGITLSNLLGRVSMAEQLEALARDPLTTDAALLVAQGLLPGVLFGIAIGFGLWRWGGRRAVSFPLAILAILIGSGIAFLLMYKFGRIPKGQAFTAHLSFARYVVLGTAMAASSWVALALISARFRTAEHTALLIGTGAVCSFLSMVLLQWFDAIDQPARLPWVFPAAMAFWQATVCAAAGYGFSREPR